MPEVSIVIPFYNCPYINQAIQSAMNQTFQDIEIIVVDDGSSPEYQKKVKPFLHAVRYIRQANGGTGAALNTGIQNANGRYFTWLSADDLYHPEKVGLQRAFMKAHHVAASYSAYDLINEKGETIHPNLGVHFPTKKEFCLRMMQGNFINGCTIMLEMSIFDEVGMFNPGLRFTHDYDMWLRVLPRHHFHYIPKSLVSYRVHDGMSSRKYQPQIRKEVIMVQKRHRKMLQQLAR